MFFVELRPASNNKDIFNVEYTHQCKITFELPKHIWDIAQCANCQRYGHTKNHCHLKLRCVKCTDDHMTNQYHWKERSRDVQCVLRGGNHPANYKGCTVSTKKKTRTTSPVEIIHSFHTNQTCPVHSTRSNICSNHQTKIPTLPQI
jgi:hypothetical protein